MGIISRPAVPLSLEIGHRGWCAEENAADQIKHYQQFTVRHPDGFYAGDGAGWLISHRGWTKFLNGPRPRFWRPVSRISYAQVDRIIEGKMASVIFCQDSRAFG